MDPDRLRERVVDQFSYRGERADVWRAFDYLLDTDAYLNVGYSEWYLPHVLAASQRRLATEVGNRLGPRLPDRSGRILDVGCGRGGPAIQVAERFDARVVGLDLVPYNVARAVENARGRDVDVDFVVGDAARPPVADDSLVGCFAVDSLVYVPDRDAVFAALAEALESGGALAFSTLVVRAGVDDGDRRTVDRFAEAWDMPPLGTVAEHERALEREGFTVVGSEDISANSVDRFRTWTTPFTWLADGPAGPLLERALASRGLDASTVLDQVRRAHEALPYIGHVLVTAER